ETSEKFEIVKEALKGAVTLEKDKITKPICREYLLLEKLDEYINSKAFMRLVHDEKIQKEVARYISAYDHDHQEDDSCEIKQGDAKKIERKMENYKKLERYMQRVKKDFEKEVLLQMEYILSFFVEESIIAEIEERDIKSIRKTLPFLRPDGIQPTAMGIWDTVKKTAKEFLAKDKKAVTFLGGKNPAAVEKSPGEGEKDTKGKQDEVVEQTPEGKLAAEKKKRAELEERAAAERLSEAEKPK
ncbi:MAG: uncharacterized protein A8A55_3439, partial [Amphiamblys sp. WSBS2006]